MKFQWDGSGGKGRLAWSSCAYRMLRHSVALAVCLVVPSGNGGFEYQLEHDLEGATTTISNVHYMLCQGCSRDSITRYQSSRAELGDVYFGVHYLVCHC